METRLERWQRQRQRQRQHCASDAGDGDAVYFYGRRGWGGGRNGEEERQAVTRASRHGRRARDEQGQRSATKRGESQSSKARYAREDSHNHNESDPDTAGDDERDLELVARASAPAGRERCRTRRRRGPGRYGSARLVGGGILSESLPGRDKKNIDIGRGFVGRSAWVQQRLVGINSEAQRRRGETWGRPRGASPRWLASRPSSERTSKPGVQGKGPCRRGGRKHRKASETHHCSRGDPVELPARITLP